jgi:hypothetical protein
LLLLVLGHAHLALAQGPSGEESVLQPDSGRLNRPGSALALRLRAELGGLALLSNRITYGSDGTTVNYRTDGDQNTLFLFWRLSAEVMVRARHTVLFVYQPLVLETEAVLERALTLGDVRFAQGTPTRFGYGFDFYRIDYQYDIYPDARRELAFGAGLQVRNARVTFVSADGTTAFTQSNLGFVPLLRMRGRYVFENAMFVETEVDGLITPVPAGRGPDDELALGAILDASLRGGMNLTHWAEAFLNLRYLGGGFRGESDPGPGLSGPDRWSSNWLHTLTLSVGLGIR